MASIRMAFRLHAAYTKQKEHEEALETALNDQRNAEASLIDIQHMLHRILDTTPTLIYIYDLQEHCNVYANREVVNFLGYTHEEVRAMGSDLFKNIMHHDDLEPVARHHARMEDARDEEVLEIEYRMLHSDGEWRWLRSRDILFARTPEGRGKQILGSAEDITKSKKAEEALSENEKRYRTLVENISDVVFSVDLQGRMSYISRPSPGCSASPRRSS